MLRDEPISEKVDQYGMGIMLWEMYTGALPWSDKNYHQMIHTVAVRNERPPITPDMPRELVKVIEGCWHPLPSKRPPFHELRQTFKELQKIVASQAPTSRTSSAPSSVSSSQSSVMSRPAVAAAPIQVGGPRKHPPPCIVCKRCGPRPLFCVCRDSGQTPKKIHQSLSSSSSSLGAPHP